MRRHRPDVLSFTTMTPDLRFGIFHSPYHPPGVNPALQLRRDLELVTLVEDLGFDEMWFGEHHSGGYEIIGAPEIFMAVAAERTKRIKLGTGVISLPYHHPFMVRGADTHARSPDGWPMHVRIRSGGVDERHAHDGTRPDCSPVKAGGGDGGGGSCFLPLMSRSPGRQIGSPSRMLEQTCGP